MRIYQINLEEEKYGLGWSSFRVSAVSFDEALSKAKKRLKPKERIEDVELLASDD